MTGGVCVCVLKMIEAEHTDNWASGQNLAEQHITFSYHHFMEENKERKSPSR